MASYILHPGGHVITYPETCLHQPADSQELEQVLAGMQAAFHRVLSHRPPQINAVASTELILDAFIAELQTSSPRYQVPHWQTYRFGPRNGPTANGCWTNSRGSSASPSNSGRPSREKNSDGPMPPSRPGANRSWK